MRHVVPKQILASALGVMLALPLSSAVAADGEAKILSDLRKVFVARSANATEVSLLDLAPVSWGVSSYILVAHSIRPDQKFQGSFEDELFGVFLVDSNFSSLLRTLDVWATPRWGDYSVEIAGSEGSSVLISGRGATYGDEARQWRFNLGDNAAEAGTLNIRNERTRDPIHCQSHASAPAALMRGVRPHSDRRRFGRVVVMSWKQLLIVTLMSNINHALERTRDG